MNSLGSNRTFMELKFASFNASRYLSIGSNRTFMELKFVCDGSGSWVMSSF